MNAKDVHWFKRKRYGYGWTPSSWQGWAVIILYVVVAVGGALTLIDMPENSFSKELGFYLLVMLISTVALIKISYKKGPSPKWQ